MLKKIDYLAYLEDCWQRHLLPRKDNAPTVISTFSGCGGSSLGYSMAGFRELLAVEWDKNAVDTFKINFPDIPVYHGDIAELSVEQALTMSGLKVGQLDVLDGSPPCQGFSTAGKRIINDNRNRLFLEYVRLLKGLKPKVFLMENVSGMIKGKMKIVFAEIMKELKVSGYNVSVRLMNTMYFGVPQSRQRLIFIGVRDDIGINPSYPEGETIPITFRQACFDLAINNSDDRYLDEILKKVAKVQPDKINTDWRKYKEIKGNVAGMMSTKWIGWDKICPTIPKSEISITGIIHPDRVRYISSSEAKRLFGFPDSFIFIGGRSKVINRLGNSVPPLFMKAIAEHIRTELLGENNKTHGGEDDL